MDRFPYSVSSQYPLPETESLRRVTVFTRTKGQSITSFHRVFLTIQRPQGRGTRGKGDAKREGKDGKLLYSIAPAAHVNSASENWTLCTNLPSQSPPTSSLLHLPLVLQTANCFFPRRGIIRRRLIFFTAYIQR